MSGGMSFGNHGELHWGYGSFEFARKTWLIRVAIFVMSYSQTAWLF